MTDQDGLSAKLDRLLAKLGDDDAPQPKIGPLWESWAKGMILMKSKATAMSIRSSWKHLGPLIAEKRIDEITGEFWTNEMIPAIREKTHPGFKFFNMRKWLAMFFKWCEENQKGPKGWHRPRLVDPDPERDAGRAYSLEETERMIANADWLLLPKIIMGLEHFMRRSEIALLAKDRVDRVRRIIRLRAEDTKIRKARSFPYNDRLEALFVIMDQKHAELGIVSPWVFPSPINPQKSIGRDGFSTSWATCKRLANVIGKFHWLRHTGLTRAAREGLNVALVCQAAGLDVGMAQKVYWHFDEEDMRAIFKKSAS